MRNIFLTASITVLSAIPAHADGGFFSGEQTFSIEGGVAFPMDRSDRALIVENNNAGGGDGPAPWDVTPLLWTDTLNYGAIASYASELSVGLASGGSIYIAVDGASGEGSVDLSGLGFPSGAIPGTHDDGYLIQDDWDPVATVTTDANAISLGYTQAFGDGFSWSAGLMYAEVNQDLGFGYDHDPAPGDVSLTGVSLNRMRGATVGLGYSRALSGKWSLGFDADIALLANEYRYDYDRVDSHLASGADTHISESGTSTVTRLDASATIGYQMQDNLTFTGRIGVTNYSGIGSGLENLLNEENTVAVINPVTTDVTLPYIRFGAVFTF